jgi:hypothetical protein
MRGVSRWLLLLLSLLLVPLLWMLRVKPSSLSMHASN